MNILITGANRGLGLGIVKYLSNQNYVDKVIATCRNASQELKQLSQDNNNVHILNLDLKNINSYTEITENISKLVGQHGLNILINNAGVTTKFTKLNLVKTEQLLENLTVNTIAPIMLSKSMHPLLKLASDKNRELPMGVRRAAVINISSVLGSIAQNEQGGFYPYRCSKAALNAATKSMSLDLKNDKILVVSMHPGWVKTDMGGSKAPLDIDTSVKGIFHTIDNLTEEDTARWCYSAYSPLSTRYSPEDVPPNRRKITLREPVQMFPRSPGLSSVGFKAKVFTRFPRTLKIAIEEEIIQIKKLLEEVMQNYHEINVYCPLRSSFGRCY